MKAIALTLSLIIGLSVSVQAQTPESVTQYKPTDRIGKNWTVVGQLAGVTSKVGNENGIAAGYYLNPDSVLLIEVYKSEGSSFLNDLDDGKIKSNNIAVMYKKFVGNSFYVKGGVIGRNVDYSNYETPQDETFQGSSVAGSIGIGNQWHIGNFTLGADWVSFTQPITTNITSEQASDPSSTWSQQNLKDAKKRYLEDSYLQYVRFYIGASF